MKFNCRGIKIFSDTSLNTGKPKWEHVGRKNSNKKNSNKNNKTKKPHARNIGYKGAQINTSGKSVPVYIFVKRPENGKMLSVFIITQNENWRSRKRTNITVEGGQRGNQ